PYSIILSIGVPVFPNEFGACVDFLSSPVAKSRLGFDKQQSVFRAIADAEDGGTRDCNVALSLLPIELLANGGQVPDPRCTQSRNGCLDSQTVIACGGDSGVGTLTRCAPTRGGPNCKVPVIPEAGVFGICFEEDCVGGIPSSFCENGTVYNGC